MSRILIALTIVLCLCGAALAAGPDEVTGRWLNQEKESIIDIAKCGSLYCGKITWLKEPNYPANDKKGMAGKPKIDRENPDPQLRNHPIDGLQILWGFKYAGDNVWDSGRIYDPRDGKTYKCKMTLEGNTLKIRGFIGISLIGKTNVWTRVK